MGLLFFVPFFVKTGASPPLGSERNPLGMETHHMTNEQIEAITRLQQAGKGYRTIAAETGLSLNSVKSWCRRHPTSTSPPSFCQQCGSAIKQIPGKRARRFCSDACRMLWVEGASGSQVAQGCVPPCLPLLRDGVYKQPCHGQLLQPGVLCQGQNAGGRGWIRRCTRR